MNIPSPQSEASITPKTYTLYQGKFLAHQLTLEGTAEESIARTVASAKVDTNPHQVEAALFALQSPLSQGVILADEVGLGKTIEASLVIAQRWAEKRRKILLIVPATLRKQWSQELWEKFHLPTEILEAKAYNARKKQKILTPFLWDNKIIICSYEFAAKYDIDVRNIDWDLVVFDEAHKLRNVYKGIKNANKLKEAVKSRQKILLSATPLQNSLMELYGLVSIIDDHFFGHEAAFKAAYGGTKPTEANLNILKHRLRTVCHRTLRKQVQAEGAINFTRRHAITQDFTPSQQELDLYKQVSEYLQRDDILSIKPNARHLVTLGVRKILASSSKAICGTLEKIVGRLENDLEKAITPDILDDLEGFEDTAEEIETDAEDNRTAVNQAKLAAEIDELKSYKTLAEKIANDAKGEALLKAIEKGMAKTRELGGREKAVIFTESCRTQAWLSELLSNNGYAGKIVLMNGSNNDAASKALYAAWAQKHKGSDRISGSPTADKKAAIVDAFRDDATILIATESGAEGVNLQFCSLLINYDLPWNPQRVEQRIGRVHRYGQKNDVVIVNFINKGNKADELVYNLLDRKFRLFDGVFGASDEILGAIESGVDIEMRINAIYQQCRNDTQIEAEFEKIQQELDETLQTREQQTRQKLLENFDAAILERLKSRREKLQRSLDAYEQRLILFAKCELPQATFHNHHFTLDGEAWHVNWEQAEAANGHFFRIGAEKTDTLIQAAQNRVLPPATIRFHYSNRDHQGLLSDIQQHRGRSGWLRVHKLTIESVEKIERLIFAGSTDTGETLDEQQCCRLLELPAEVLSNTQDFPSQLDVILRQLTKNHLEEAQQKNERYFAEETEKLDRWADDKKEGVEQEIKALEKEIKELNRSVRTLATLAEKTAAKRQVSRLKNKRDEKMQEFFQMRKAIDEEEQQLLDSIESKLELRQRTEELFAVRWELV